MKQIISTLLLLFIFISTYAAADSIVVNKDKRIDQLVYKQYVINKRSNLLTSSGLYKGYRVQAITTNNRTQAFQVKNSLLTNFSDHKSYILFQSPNFKVRIGNFLKRSDAEKLKAQVNKLIPQGVFVVEDTIEFTPVNDNDIK